MLSVPEIHSWAKLATAHDIHFPGSCLYINIKGESVPTHTLPLTGEGRLGPGQPIPTRLVNIQHGGRFYEKKLFLAGVGSSHARLYFLRAGDRRLRVGWSDHIFRGNNHHGGRGEQLLAAHAHSGASRWGGRVRTGEGAEMTTPIELTRCPGHRGQPACQSCARYLRHGETLTAGTPTFLSTGELQRAAGGQATCMAFLAPGHQPTRHSEAMRLISGTVRRF